MTTEANGRKATSACNGVTTNFGIPFQFISNADLRVYLLDSLLDANEDGTLLVEGSDYTVNGVGRAGGASITTAVAHPADKYIRRWRQTSRAQSQDYVPNDPFPADSHELQLDRLSLVDEEAADDLATQQARAVTVPRGESGFDLPDLADRAGQMAAWAAGGEFVAATTPEPGSDAALRADLALITGSALVGFDKEHDYGEGSVGRELRRLTDETAALPTGTTVFRNATKTITADVDGTTDGRGEVNGIVLTGAYPAAKVENLSCQLQLSHDTGSVALAGGLSGYIRLGFEGVGTGNVQEGRVYDGHLSNEGGGIFDVGTVYNANNVDLLDGTGPFNTIRAFNCDDQGHASRVITEAVAFHANDFTASTNVVKPFMAHFWSKMTAGELRYSFLGTGGAQMVNAGKVRFGNYEDPNNALEVVNGYSKLSSDASMEQPLGEFHELTGHGSAYAAKIRNTHAATPFGLEIRFAAAAPNNMVQKAVNFADNVGDKFIVWSNGNVVNTNNSYGAISDRKLKTGIRDAGDQLSDIRAIRVRKYRLKADGDNGHEHIGVIAQEIEKVSPGVVHDTPDMERYFEPEMVRGGVAEPDVVLIGKGVWKERPTDKVTKSVNYSVLYMKALKALQELADRVDAQASEIAELRGMVGR